VPPRPGQQNRAPVR